MKMVTRTVTSYSATVLVVDTATTEVGTRQYVFTTNPKNEEAVIKYANEKLQGTGLRAVAVKETAVSTSLYGMPEEKFLELAEKLPPRAKKAAAEDDKEIG